MMTQDVMTQDDTQDGWVLDGSKDQNGVKWEPLNGQDVIGHGNVLRVRLCAGHRFCEGRIHMRLPCSLAASARTREGFETSVRVE